MSPLNPLTCYDLIFSITLFCLMCCVNSQFDTTKTMATTLTPSNQSDGIKCGETQKMVDECFKDLPPHLMEFLQTTKIAVNKQEIESKCTVFKRGMKCFDSYTDRCLSNEKLVVFKNNVAGARRFLAKFCDDEQFQQDYLKNKDCFTYIQEDWKRCTRTYQHIISEEFQGISKENVDPQNITRNFMQFCCTRHAYENCIYNSARYKCYKHSAKFARDTAKMLTEEKHYSNCRQYENVLCAASSRRLQLNGHLHNGLLAGMFFWLIIQFANIQHAITKG